MKGKGKRERKHDKEVGGKIKRKEMDGKEMKQTERKLR